MPDLPNFFGFYRNVIGGVAGLTADANSLVNYARIAAQNHLLAYNEDIPVELLAQRLCDKKQQYTQFGGAFLSLFLSPYPGLMNFARPPPFWRFFPLRWI